MSLVEMVVAVIEPSAMLDSAGYGSPPKPGGHCLAQSGFIRVARSGDNC